MGFCPRINAGFRPTTLCHSVFVEGSEPRLSRWTSHCQSFSPAFIRSVTASFIHSFTHLCVHFPTHSSFIHSFTHSLIHSFIHSFTHSLTHSLTRSYMFDQPSQHSCHSMTHLIPTTPLMRSTFLGAINFV